MAQDAPPTLNTRPIWTYLESCHRKTVDEIVVGRRRASHRGLQTPTSLVLCRRGFEKVTEGKKIRAHAEELARRQAEEQAKRHAEEQARLRAEEEARRSTQRPFAFYVFTRPLPRPTHTLSFRREAEEMARKQAEAAAAEERARQEADAVAARALEEVCSYRCSAITAAYGARNLIVRPLR